MAVRRAAVAWAAAIFISCGLLALPLVAYAATSVVTIQASAFNPPTSPIRIGDTVRWNNADGVAHTATSDTGLWDSGVLGTGGSFSFTFGSAGTFAYHCTIHPFMTGTVVVQVANTPQPTAPPPPTQQPTPPPTPLPTPVRTAAPTAAPTAPPTAAPTAAPTEAPATPTPSASPTPTPAAVETLTVSASPSAVAVQVTSAPAAGGGGPGPILIGAAALAVVALGGIAFFLARRS
jgi:plastocyanin